MITIHKYQFAVTDNVTIEMPVGATITHVGIQNAAMPAVANVWALVDTDRPTEQRHFRIFGTGHTIPTGPHLNFVATWIAAPFVWHMFEIGRG